MALTSWMDRIEIVTPADCMPAQPSEDAERVLFFAQYRVYPAWLISDNAETGRATILFYDDCWHEARFLTVDSWRVMQSA